MSDPACTFDPKSGKLFWRDWEKSAQEIERQAKVFEAEAARQDWWGPVAADFSAQCRRALVQYETYHRRHAA